jgi:hypothetical protein
MWILASTAEDGAEQIDGKHRNEICHMNPILEELVK